MPERPHARRSVWKAIRTNACPKNVEMQINALFCAIRTSDKRVLPGFAAHTIDVSLIVVVVVACRDDLDQSDRVHHRRRGGV